MIVAVRKYGKFMRKFRACRKELLMNIPIEMIYRRSGNMRCVKYVMGNVKYVERNL